MTRDYRLVRLEQMRKTRWAIRQLIYGHKRGKDKNCRQPWQVQVRVLGEDGRIEGNLVLSDSVEWCELDRLISVSIFEMQHELDKDGINHTNTKGLVDFGYL